MRVTFKVSDHDFQEWIAYMIRQGLMSADITDEQAIIDAMEVHELGISDVTVSEGE